MDKIRLGIIGLGWFGEIHGDAIAGIPEIELAALCTRTESRLDELAKKFGVTQTYTDYTEMLANPDIDAVSVVTMWDQHTVPVLDALQAGKHVFLEKPMASTVEDCRKICAAAAKAKRWENNFVHQMSTIWCPVTDEVNSGGGLHWEKLGLDWESCCEFCNEDVTDEDFPAALELLIERAKESYELAGGKYAINPKSPVQGAIKIPGLTEYLGTWKLEISTPNGRTFENTLLIKRDAGDLAGTMTGRRGESEISDIESDEEGNISFTVTRERNGEEFVIQYKGEVDGDKITGTAEIDAGGQTFEMEFEGERQPDAPADEEQGEA